MRISAQIAVWDRHKLVAYCLFVYDVKLKLRRCVVFPNFLMLTTFPNLITAYVHLCCCLIAEDCLPWVIPGVKLTTENTEVYRNFIIPFTTSLH